jgi:hypothetical protein
MVQGSLNPCEGPTQLCFLCRYQVHFKVPLALALGRCLGLAVMKKAKEEDEWKMQEGSPEA